MDSETVATPGTSITGSFEKLILSTMRLSSAATLYGVQQLEAATTLWQGGDRLTKQMDRFGTTVGSLSQCLADEISPGKKNALESISNISTQVVRQSWAGISLLDPRQILRLSNNLMHVSTGAVSNLVGKRETSPEAEPRLATEVLAN